MSDKKQWTEENITDQTGRIAIVTGANSGIGFETARALAQKGATMIMACRNKEKMENAAEKIQSKNPEGNVVTMVLDLSDLDSVRQFADEFRAQFGRLDLLINNAGIMVPPYGLTAQGFETQFGVNHLGHFALTGLLLDILIDTPGSRVVTVSSMAHRFGSINFDDLNWEQGYSPNAAYGQSKLANLLFTHALQRKLEAAGYETLAVAAHPGWTATNLQAHSSMLNFLNRFFAQDPPMGALPTLMAAVDPGVSGGEYYGPSGGIMESRGYPKRVNPNGKSQDEEVASQLWDISEELTGVYYQALNSKSL